MPDLSGDDTSVRGSDSGPPPRYWIDRLEGEADLDGVLEVEGESFTNPWTREMYTWELQNRSVCHIFVARTRECPVAGFCAFWLVLDEIHINNVATNPKFRGRGIGRLLLQTALRWGRQRGLRQAVLEVRAGNEAAQQLYRRCGFEVIGRRRGYYRSPVEDALLMAVSLDQNP